MIGNQQPNYIILYSNQYLLLKKLVNKSHVRPALTGALLYSMARDLGHLARFEYCVQSDDTEHLAFTRA